MTDTDLARTERAALSDLLDERGPDAPTLCEGWTTRDLAAHLVVREARPDAALGIVIGPLAGWTAKVQDDAARRDYAGLVDAVRTGPPALSYYRLPGLDSALNTVEYFVHHEDVRRAEPGWAPRDLPTRDADELWGRLRRIARMFYRRVRVGVVLERTDGRGEVVRVRDGEPTVTLRGSAQDLLLRTYGRTEVDVTVDGDPQAVATFGRARLGI